MKKYKTTPYRRGRAFEYRVRDILREKGYTAERMPGSKGSYDVYANKDGVLLYIQVKSKKEYMLKKGWTRLIEDAANAGAIPLLAHRTREGRKRPVIFETKDGERYEV